MVGSTAVGGPLPLIVFTADKTNQAIVKLIMRYEGMGPDDKRYAIGTGYLVSADTLITAGHCVFDINHESKKGLGRVTEMKVFIGYSGKKSVDTGGVQQRKAASVATTVEWVTSGNRRGDVAFVRLDKAFTGNLRLFTYKDTPLAQPDVMLGIVGYPGDKDVDSEKGAEMYELMESNTYNLEKNPYNMLSYTISTFKGQSGSPVLQRDRSGLTVIGTHCYGETPRNSASVIGGPYGVSYATFLTSLTTPDPAIPSITSLPISTLLSSTESFLRTDTNTEGFLDILKNIGRVVTPVAQATLPFVSPLLGPLGAPVSAIGGIALGALAKAVSESLLAGETPAGTPISLVPGTAERAVLAESALQAVLRMERSPASEKLLGAIRNKYTGSGFTRAHADKLGRQMVPLLSQAGLRLATTEGLVKKEAQWAGGAAQLPISHHEGGMSTGDSNADDLIKTAGEVPIKRATGTAETESFFGDISSFLSKGLSVAKPVLLTSARAGLEKIDEILSKKGSGTEAALVDDGRGVVSDEKAAALLAHRAVVAECALQAVVEADKEALKESVILGGADGARQEGFFDGLLKTVQVIGPAVLSVAPAVLETAVPHLLSAVAGTEADVVAPPPAKKLENGMVNGAGNAKVRKFSVCGNEGKDDRLFVTAQEIGLGEEGKPKTDIDWVEGKVVAH
ncbi:trypsin-like cysteine/serine peptidase domain-containing protein [Lasiosphaeris hirsuta]|uniref:Serine protease n=1 Tax=Lasiosphaeris hirsuta TaxID=260670 RepID=A0AA40AEU3_9PEZI|nr:trypsin-like cysteine/serine peptidase domain-containing protein [Lasiosphaeris hirsuta]